jgi:hypothetical protein
MDQASQELFHSAAKLPPDEQIHLATYTVTAKALAERGHRLVADASRARIMRSTVMKPESGAVIPDVHRRLESLSRC